jgi:putative membrane protein
MKTNKLFGAFTFYTMLLAATGGMIACNNKQEPATEDTSKVAAEENDVKFDNKKQENDAQFLVDATAFNLEEIKLGYVVQQRSNNANVKALAKMMVTEHEKGLKELRDMAKTKQVTIPDSVNTDGAEAYATLTAQTGDAFNKAYCESLLKSHEKIIASYEKIAADSRDQDIKEWATTKLPDLRKHVDHIFECQKKLGVKVQ